MSDEINWLDLQRPFPTEAVNQKPKKNKKTGEVVWLDYIGHAEVTERFNEVDPTWTWAPFALAEDGGPLVRTSGDTLELWINLTIGGVSKPGVGTVDAGAWSGETAKELISDALRNAGMRFGVGLDLWKRHVSIPGDREWPENPPENAAQDRAPTVVRKQGNHSNAADSSGALTAGQSKNAYRLFKKLEKEQGWDRPMYYDAILISTGIETTDDRTLSSRDAGKLISYLKEQAGEEADNRVFDATPPPSDELFANSEPF